MASLKKDDFLSISSNLQLANYLNVPLRRLTMYAYGCVRKYSCKVIPKKNSGGTRIISAPVGQLKSLQRKLADCLSACYEPLDCVYGFVEGRSVADNARMHTRKRYVLTLDLEDFFPSITAPRVWGLFIKRLGLSKEVADTLTNLCCFDGCLPQGAPTSPVISNMICWSMDRAFLSLASNYRISYSRYADDLVFSSTSSHRIKSIFDFDKEGIDGVSDKIIGIVETNGFHINKQKVHIASSGCRQLVCGIVVNKKCNIKRSDYRKMRSLFHIWKAEGAESALIQYLEGDPCYANRFCFDSGDDLERELIRHIRGRLDYYTMVTSANGYPTEPIVKLWTMFRDVTGEDVPIANPDRYAVHLSWSYDAVSEMDNNVLCGDGTGFFCNGYFITCDHCLPKDNYDKDNKRTTVILRFGERVKELNVDRFRRLRGFDFAYCEVADDLVLSIRRVNPRYRPQMGEPVIAAGFAGGKSKVYCQNAKVEQQRSSGALITVDAPFIQGMSGGPVFNVRHELIGIVCKGSNESSYSRFGEFQPLSGLYNSVPFLRSLK